MEFIQKNLVSYDSRALKKGFYLGYIYIVLRLALVVLLVPAIHFFWNKKSFGHEGMPEDS